MQKLTRDLATLSVDGIYNLEAIKYYYDNDLFPWSPQLLKRGPLDFDPLGKLS